MLEVRKLKLEDSLNLYHFNNQVFSENSDYLLPFSENYTVDVQETITKKFIENPNFTLFICIENEKIIGSLDLITYSNLYKCHLSKLGILVLNEYKRKKVGTLLFEHLINYVKNYRQNILKIEAECFSKNLPIINFLLHHGFQIEGTKIKSIKNNNQFIDIVEFGYFLKT